MIKKSTDSLRAKHFIMSPVNELLDLLKNLFLTYLAFCRKSASTVTFDKNDPSPNLKGITTIQHKKYTNVN